LPTRKKATRTSPTSSATSAATRRLEIELHHQVSGIEERTPSPSSASRDRRLAAPCCLNSLESLELRVPKIKRLIIASLLMCCPERF
jgi:hypothetical protein